MFLKKKNSIVQNVRKLLKSRRARQQQQLKDETSSVSTKPSLLDDDEELDAIHDTIFWGSQTDIHDSSIDGDVQNDCGGDNQEVLCQALHESLTVYFGTCGTGVRLLGEGCGFQFGGLEFGAFADASAQTFTISTSIRTPEGETRVHSCTRSVRLLDGSGRLEFQQMMTELLTTAIGRSRKTARRNRQ
mmetsp:Transcript_21939/g.50634  ORF Transcript_21939/g.50634 Transcript_21939/m.50634 type:complete len:188 (+) Transcript_21939:154-717(+)